MKGKPFGVTIYSLFLIGSGVFLLIRMLPGLGKETTAGISDPGYLAYLAGYWLLVAAGVSLLLVLGTCLFKLRNWARQLIVNFAVLLGLPVSLIMLYAMGLSSGEFTGLNEADWAISWFIVAAGPVTIWYFLRPSVKAQFISKTTNR